jgi:phage gp36-like protein
MSYCTVDDIKKAIPEKDIIQLTDDVGTGIIDTTRTDEAILNASDIIDGYLSGGGYTLPLSPVPGIVRSICCDLAIHYLYGRRFAAEMPQGIELRQSNALKLLGLIQAGKISLGIASPDGYQDGQYKTNKTASDRIFPKDVLDSY